MEAICKVRKTRTYWPGWHNNLNRYAPDWPCTEHQPMSRSRRFAKGWVTFGEYFIGKAASPTNHCLCQKSRVIALSFGITISAVHHFVFSQYTHLTDRQTDGRTEMRHQYRALHYMQSHGKELDPTQSNRSKST